MNLSEAKLYVMGYEADEDVGLGMMFSAVDPLASVSGMADPDARRQALLTIFSRLKQPVLDVLSAYADDGVVVIEDDLAPSMIRFYGPAAALRLVLDEPSIRHLRIGFVPEDPAPRWSDACAPRPARMH